LERLQARKVGARRREICCIPLFARDLALGDVVEVDRHHRLVRVVTASGRTALRVFLPPDDARTHDMVGQWLTAAGALHEWVAVGVLAIDAANSEQVKKISEFIESHDLKTLPG
jgi:hypothetical protein